MVVIHLDTGEILFGIVRFIVTLPAPGVADLAVAGNWAEEYLAAEARSKTGHGGPPGSDWAAEFLEGRAPPMGPQLQPHLSAPPSDQWARDYLAQNEHKVWYVMYRYYSTCQLGTTNSFREKATKFCKY